MTRLSARGDTVHSRTYQYRPRRITRAVADTLVERLASGAMEYTSAFPSLAAARSAFRPPLHLPDFAPPVTDVVAGEDGTVWLRREDLGGGQVHWLALDARGGVAGVVTTPTRFRIRHALRDRIWALEADGDGMSYITRYRVRPAGR